MTPMPGVPVPLMPGYGYGSGDMHARIYPTEARVEYENPGPTGSTEEKILEGLQNIQERLTVLEHSRSASGFVNRSFNPLDTSLSPSRVTTGLQGIPPGVKSPFIPRAKAPKGVPNFTKTHNIYTLASAVGVGLGPLAPMAILPDPNTPQSLKGEGSVSIQKPKAEATLPSFTGKDLEDYAADFCRYLRTTGRDGMDEKSKADLVIITCKTPDLKKSLSEVLTESESWVDFLISIEKLFPSFTTDLAIRNEIEKIPKLKDPPFTGEVSSYVQTLAHKNGDLITPSRNTKN